LDCCIFAFAMMSCEWTGLSRPHTSTHIIRERREVTARGGGVILIKDYEEA